MTTQLTAPERPTDPQPPSTDTVRPPSASTAFWRGLPLPLVAAATTWVLMLSWERFAVQWGSYLGPLLGIALAVVVSGVALRVSALPRRAAAVLHVVVIALVVWLVLGGVPWHPFSSTGDIAGSIRDAVDSASAFAPPIPSNVPGIAPLMIPCGAASLLVVDFLASWLRRVPLTGLPLLAVYCVPISLLGGGISWLVFVLAAIGFLLMLVLQESDHVARWGRPLGGAARDPQGFGVSTGASRGTAATVGTVAVVLAVILPIFVPTFHLGHLGLFGPGGSGGDGVNVVNPVTDMRRDLRQGKDIPLLDIRTNDPAPSYIRIAALTRYDGVQWTPGDRSIVDNQMADGPIDSEVGASRNAADQTHFYRVSATDDFHSRWLPTAYPASYVMAPGDWHYDRTTLDFIAGDDHTDTAGLSWTMQSAKPDVSAYSMVHSLNAPLAIQTPYTALPSSMPKAISDLALQVTEGAKSRFERAVMLQDWFQHSGGFRYSLKTTTGSSKDDLLHFLGKEKGGRVGYCEQFATAFAVMARSLEMPTRVAVGFLNPTKNADGDFVFSSHDLHAWPEVYFQGSGWVVFEPTPTSHTGSVPNYTTGPIRKTRDHQLPQTQGGKVSEDTSATSAPHQDQTQTTTTSSSGSNVPWTALLVGLLVVVVLGALALVPRAVRRSRRRRRLTGGVEDVWDELRDTGVDLGVSWPRGRSPYETGRQLVGWFGPEPDGPPAARPARGPGLAPHAEEAMARIVLAVERLRYARTSDDVPGSLSADLETVIAALEHGSPRRTLRRSVWLPRSLAGGRGARSEVTVDDRTPAMAATSGPVDHVG